MHYNNVPLIMYALVIHMVIHLICFDILGDLKECFVQGERTTKDEP